MGNYTAENPACFHVPFRMVGTSFQAGETKRSFGWVSGFHEMLTGFLRWCPWESQGFRHSLQLSSFAVHHYAPAKRCCDTAVINDKVLAGQRVDLGHASVESEVFGLKDGDVGYASVDGVTGG